MYYKMVYMIQEFVFNSYGKLFMKIAWSSGAHLEVTECSS